MGNRSKTITLNKSDRTNADIDARIQAELSILPIKELPKAPAKLKGRAVALAEWKFITGLYGETLAQLISAFDETLLVNYCLLVEELRDTQALRDAAYAMLTTLNTALKKKKVDEKALAGNIEHITEAVMKVETVLTRKREQLLKFSAALYLTPKARAGVAPPMKPAPVAPDDMDSILNDATSDL